jgi:hypothetical protein
MNRRMAVIWISLILLLNFIVIVVNTPTPVKAEYFSANVLVNDEWINNSTQMYPSILVDNNDTIYVIWEDWRNDADGYYSWTPVYGGTDGAQNGDIYVCNSTDGGFTFGTDHRVNDDIGKAQQRLDWSYRAIACGDDGTLHAVWTDWRNDADGMEGDEGGIDGVDNTDIYYANSSDKGNTWSTNKQINDDGGIAKQESATIAVDSKGHVHIVWEDNRSGNTDIYYANSTDGGITFSPNKRINDVSTGSVHPTIDIDDATDYIYVVWEDYRNLTTRPDIYFARSTDGGLTFEANKKVNKRDADDDVESFLTVRDGLIAVSWGHYLGGDYGIYFATSTDGGGNFSDSVKVDDTGGYGWPHIAIDSTQKISVVWEDSRNGNLDIYYANSTDGGLTFGDNQMINDDSVSAGQRMPCIDVDSNDFLHIAWADWRRGSFPNRDIYYTRTIPASSLPDYIPYESLPSSSMNIMVNSSIEISTKIKNKGWRDAINTSTIAFYNQTTPLSPFKEYTVPPLNISEVTNETYTAIWPAPPNPGTYYVYIKVDYYDNVTGELNESNNIYLIEFNVYNILPPTNLTIDKRFVDDLILNWEHPQNSPSPVDHYHIYHSLTWDGFDFTTPWVNTSNQPDPLGGINPLRTSWNLTGALLDDSKNYFYIVRAIDAEGWNDTNTNIVGKYVIPLKKGWNMISLPLAQRNTSIPKVLQTIDGEYNVIWVYDAKEGIWRSSSTDLTDINRFLGLWIHMKNTCNLSVLGAVPESTGIALYEGWNLVGYPSMVVRDPNGALSGIGWQAVQHYDAFDVYDPWKHNSTNKPYTLNDLITMEPGCGYWIYITINDTWAATRTTNDNKVVVWRIHGFSRELGNQDYYKAISHSQMETDEESDYKIDISPEEPIPNQGVNRLDFSVISLIILFAFIFVWTTLFHKRRR